MVLGCTKLSSWTRVCVPLLIPGREHIPHQDQTPNPVPPLLLSTWVWGCSSHSEGSPDRSLEKVGPGRCHQECSAPPRPCWVDSPALPASGDTVMTLPRSQECVLPASSSSPVTLAAHFLMPTSLSLSHGGRRALLTAAQDSFASLLPSRVDNASLHSEEFHSS